eukprot:TRINITY_DN1798_c2_g1_i1.p1 TRINITY_DN1798_c2_g1~~TRINITY_DN1798_c2_g1_i1.p1  ORF type:complete len:142 (+),score=37.64 TRINITY_DN1798_c2_g1_i1:59-484(+)
MTKQYTLDQVAEHATGDDLWLVIEDKVYDVTAFQDDHPAGAEPLLEVAGTDATDAFEDVGHSEDAIEMLKDYYIGDVVEDLPKAAAAPITEAVAAAAPSSIADNKAEDHCCPIHDARVHNTLGVAVLLLPVAIAFLIRWRS